MIHRVGETYSSSDGHTYLIVTIENTDTDLPQLNRYHVRCEDDGRDITNYPAYLLQDMPLNE